MKASPTNELRRLVDRVLDSSILPVEMERLEALLADEPASMDYYLEMAGQDGLMKSALADDLPKASPRSIPFRTLSISIAAVAAALLAIAVLQWPKDEGPGDQPVASVTNSVGVVWLGSKVVTGAPLESEGRLIELESGLLEITHRSGSRVLIEGPASYEVTGPNSGRFSHGKLVAEVPPGAEGFTIDYGEGLIIDLGTEFAVQVDPEKGLTEIGVFRGEVMVTRSDHPDAEGSLIQTGHAVRLTESTTTGLRSVPFDQEEFVRQVPSRELPWSYQGGVDPLNWDVSALIWQPGDQLAVFKWMTGPESMRLQKVELLLDGELVASDGHTGSVGDVSRTEGNVYRLHVPPEKWRRGKWQLKAWPIATGNGRHSEGVLLFEDGSSLQAEAGDFTGDWEYLHDGKRYRRSFHPDGTCTLWVNDEASDYFLDHRWEVQGGILRIMFPASNLAEEHLLRNNEHLLFINQPYRNATRVK